jgi:hypothetical protein
LNKSDFTPANALGTPSSTSPNQSGAQVFAHCSEEGKTLSGEQYLIAQMQFQLLSTWRQIEEQNLAKVPGADDKSEASPADDNEIVLVELPFSSFELSQRQWLNT